MVSKCEAEAPHHLHGRSSTFRSFDQWQSLKDTSVLSTFTLPESNALGRACMCSDNARSTPKSLLVFLTEMHARSPRFDVTRIQQRAVEVKGARKSISRLSSLAAVYAIHVRPSYRKSKRLTPDRPCCAGTVFAFSSPHSFPSYGLGLGK